MNQEGFKNAYHRLISLFENISSNSSTYDELIKYFYEIGKDYGQPEFNIQILEISIEDKKQLLNHGAVCAQSFIENKNISSLE